MNTVIPMPTGDDDWERTKLILSAWEKLTPEERRVIFRLDWPIDQPRLTRFNCDIVRFDNSV